MTRASDGRRHKEKRTICLIVRVHIDKWVKINVAVEVHAGPAKRSQKDRCSDGMLERQDILDAPIIPEI